MLLPTNGYLSYIVSYTIYEDVFNVSVNKLNWFGKIGRQIDMVNLPSK